MFSVSSQTAKPYKHGRDQSLLAKEKAHWAEALGSLQALDLLAWAKYLPLVPIRGFLPSSWTAKGVSSRGTWACAGGCLLGLHVTLGAHQVRLALL